MNYGEIKFNDIANGEGVRTSLFVSGCRHHCKNCFNEQTWDFAFGQPFTEETMEEILDSCNHDWINGLSLLGGEPFEPENHTSDNEDIQAALYSRQEVSRLLENETFSSRAQIAAYMFSIGALDVNTDDNAAL